MMSTTALTPEEAARFNRTMDPTEELIGGALNPMAGTVPVSLISVADVEAFLVPQDGAALVEYGVHATVNHVEPRSLARWVRDIVGDTALADELDAIVADEEPYGKQVPRLKLALADRLAEYKAVLDPEGTGED
ncbi:MAG: hypothetical protein ABFC80_04200 [Coriobacteriales bacterium]|nr:hypothetical protein [Actinomycetes bacterium]